MKLNIRHHIAAPVFALLTTAALTLAVTPVAQADSPSDTIVPDISIVLPPVADVVVPGEGFHW